MKKLIISLVAISFLFGASVSAQNSDTELRIFAKKVVFEGTDSIFFAKQKLIKKLDPLTVDANADFKNCMYADSVIFRYNSNSWERDIVVKLHSEKEKLPLSFMATHVGTSWEVLINTIEQSFFSIKETMKRQGKAADQGNPKYEYVQ